MKTAPYCGRVSLACSGHSRNEDRSGERGHPTGPYIIKESCLGQIVKHGRSPMATFQMAFRRSTTAMFVRASGLFIYFLAPQPTISETARSKAECILEKETQALSSRKMKFGKLAFALPPVRANDPSLALSGFTTTRFGRSPTISSGVSPSKIQFPQSSERGDSKNPTRAFPVGCAVLLSERGNELNTVLATDLKKAAQLAVAEMNAKEAPALFMQYLVEAQLEQCGGNISLTAKRLGVHRNTLYRQMDKPRVPSRQLESPIK